MRCGLPVMVTYAGAGEVKDRIITLPPPISLKSSPRSRTLIMLTMATSQICVTNSSLLGNSGRNLGGGVQIQPLIGRSTANFELRMPWRRSWSIRCSGEAKQSLRTCKNCKTQFDPSANHPRACRYHTAHFGGETRRKFESVYSGGTLNTPDGGKITQYWHCCGSEDPFDPGCAAAPHSSYDD